MPLGLSATVINPLIDKPCCSTSQGKAFLIPLPFLFCGSRWVYECPSFFPPLLPAEMGLMCGFRAVGLIPLFH